MSGLIGKAATKLREEGFSAAAARTVQKLRGGAISGFAHFAPLFTGTGLEIGGPSKMFGRGWPLPIYDLAGRIDNCNFAGRTLWEGMIAEGETFQFRHGEYGFQYIREAAELSGIGDRQYDFLISSHTLEHCANPLRALAEWERVVRPRGAMALVVPHRDGTFDHRRPVTPLEHMIRDFDAGQGEDDLTHLDEILSLHDLTRDPPAGTPDQFRARSLENFDNRALHHHVFGGRSFAALLDHACLQIETIVIERPANIIAICRNRGVDNREFLCGDADYLCRSPFATDHA